MPTHFFHSGMTGAPTNTNAAGSTLDIIDACLNTGFNVRAVQSANVTANVMTVTYASAHGYESLSLLRLDGAAGGPVVRRCTVTGANTLTLPAPATPDGAVAGTLSTRVAPADWERVFSGTNVGVFRSKAIGPGSARFFYRVSDNVASATPNLLRGFETMTDADTGTGPFPTLAQVAGEGLTIGRSSPNWALVVDQRTCYLIFLNGNQSAFIAAMFGDERPYNAADAFFAVATSNNTAKLSSSQSSESFVARRVSGVGTSQLVLGSTPMGGLSGAQGRAYPSPITGAMTFVRPVLVIDNSQIAGPIRGEHRGLMHCSANPIEPGEFFTVFQTVQGVSGRVVVIRDGSSGCIGFPIDEDWA